MFKLGQLAHCIRSVDDMHGQNKMGTREPCDIGSLPRRVTLETKWYRRCSNKGTHTTVIGFGGLLELPQDISISPKNPSLHAIHFRLQPGYCKDQLYVLSSIPQAL